MRTSDSCGPTNTRGKRSMFVTWMCIGLNIILMGIAELIIRDLT